MSIGSLVLTAATTVLGAGAEGEVGKKATTKKVYKPGEALDRFIAGERVPTNAVLKDVERMRYRETGSLSICVQNFGGKCWKREKHPVRDMMKCSTIPESFVACAYEYFGEIQQRKIDRLLYVVKQLHESKGEVGCVIMKDSGKRSGVICKRVTKPSPSARGSRSLGLEWHKPSTNWPRPSEKL